MEVRVEEGKRRGKPFNQSEMARRLGVSQGRVSVVEAGKCDLGYFELDAWASAYGLTRRQFYRLLSRARERWIHRRTAAEEAPLFVTKSEQQAVIVSLQPGGGEDGTGRQEDQGTGQAGKAVG